jgi:hypothetical protein
LSFGVSCDAQLYPVKSTPKGDRCRKALLAISIIAIVLGFGARVVIQRQSGKARTTPGALQLPPAPESYSHLVQELVPLSSNEEFLRVSGYKTLRIDVTNRVKGYSRSANLTQDRFGHWIGDWSYSSPSISREFQVRGSLTGDEVFAIVAAVDTNTYGRVHKIMSADKGVAHVTSGNFGMLSGRSFHLLVVQVEGAWRFERVVSEAWH